MKNEPQRIIKGCFDKNGLPNDYKVFIEKVLEFISFYELNEIFSPKKYNRPRLLKDQYIICSVVFPSSNKPYCYVTDDENIDIGDFVLVPTGYSGDATRVKVVDIEYLTTDELPRPIETIKKIIGITDEYY